MRGIVERTLTAAEVLGPMVVDRSRLKVGKGASGRNMHV